jgi:REP element-mobilizing transposase RayT
LFITFSTCQRWQLPPEARMPVLCHCLHDHLRKVFVCAAVVMPDHVHLILLPLRDSDGTTFSLAEILGGIKGASAHAVNRLLRRRGQVWQDESFDHVVRRGEALDELHDYVRLNPVRRGLVARAEDYPWY